MYVKSVAVECNESKSCKLHIRLHVYRPCLTAEQIILLAYTGTFEQYLNIVYFLEKINCPIDAFQHIISHKSSKQAVYVYLLCLTNSIIVCIPLK